jgi:hypothetical protein
MIYLSISPCPKTFENEVFWKNFVGSTNKQLIKNSILINVLDLIPEAVFLPKGNKNNHGFPAGYYMGYTFMCALQNLPH